MFVKLRAQSLLHSVKLNVNCNCSVACSFILIPSSFFSFQYKFRDLTVEELKNVNMFFPHFRYSMDTYGKNHIL